MKLILLFVVLLNFSILQAECDKFKIAFEEGLSNQTYYETPRGHQLRYTQFKSPIPGPKNTIFFVQRRGTFLEFYEILVVPLLEREFDVWMCDLSGQGGSTRLLKHEHMQHINNFDLYVDDIDSFVKDVLVPQAEGNLFLGGYSTGGHVALRYLECYTDHPFQSAFMISPLLAFNLPLSNIAISYLLSGSSWLMNLHSYVPGASDKDPVLTMSFEGNPYTGDKARFQELQDLCVENPSLMMGGITYGWLKASCDSLRQVWNTKAMKTINIPILIATGGEDGVVDVSYNGQFVKGLNHGTHVYYPTGRHELFRETPEIRAQWWADFDLFHKGSKGAERR